MVATRQESTGISFQFPDGGLTDDQFYRFCQLNADKGFDSSTGFKLPSGADYSPDLA